MIAPITTGKTLVPQNNSRWCETLSLSVQPAFYVDLGYYKAVWHPRRFAIGWSIASVAGRAGGSTVACPTSIPGLHDVGFANPACSVASLASRFKRRHLALWIDRVGDLFVRKKITKLRPWNPFLSQQLWHLCNGFYFGIDYS